MRAYRMLDNTAPKEVVLGFAGTRADATTSRQTFVDAGQFRKKDIDIEEIEIPTAKSELLDFLNSMLPPRPAVAKK